MSLPHFHDRFFLFAFELCMKNALQRQGAGSNRAKRNAKINWNCNWICWYFEFFSSRDRNRYRYWHCIGITVRFSTAMKKKFIIKKSNGKNKIFKRTKSWKPITVDCEWNIGKIPTTTTAKKILGFRENEDEKFNGDNAVTFHMRLKRPHVLTVWL